MIIFFIPKKAALLTIAPKLFGDLKNIVSENKKPALIILGNEEHGISDTVKANCDEQIIIPWGGMKDGQKSSLIDSLNVAQASSIIFYELTK